MPLVRMVSLPFINIGALTQRHIKRNIVEHLIFQ